ncbi:DUF6361 family protein [Halomarina pelagica]|uniref:DUF6361 family protein n=1 Tax=Halomarina pelagica TaxID=2961599 RepID=UPI0020C42240|nr:DUF6361 family protein [Halomarina sp. BND7]
MSSFSWLAYSESERERTLDIISQFSERDTRDELGIGRIRDAFADLLFPGTSTIQTRAKYFLFVPWMYRELEQRRTPSDTIAKKARRYEIQLIDSLLQNEDTDGIIGQYAKGDLQRIPSNIYWSGLGEWDIRHYNGSQNQYHNSLDVYYEILHRDQRTETGDVVDEARSNWDPNLPSQPSDFPKTATLELRPVDAEYLQDKILQSVSDSMLAEVLYIGHLDADPEFPWEYPYLGQLSEDVREILAHARNFSEVMHGAALLYNLMLAQKSDDEELVDKYTSRLEEWARIVDSRRTAFNTWDIDRFWNIVSRASATTPPGMRQFVERWIDLATESPHTVSADADARQLISDRERRLKRGRARLHDARALEQWGGEAGAQQLNYRWSSAKTHLTDIFAGLEAA